MPSTTFTDQFFIVSPTSTAGTLLAVHRYTVEDKTSDGQLSKPGADKINNFNILETYTNSSLTVTNGATTTTYTGTFFRLADGSWVFSPTDGSRLHAGTLSATTAGTHNGSTSVAGMAPPCFVRGTMIAVPEGERSVESLQIGEAVSTLDHGPQILRWIGRRRVAGTGKFAPVAFEKGAFGNIRRLLVSPQHRMLVTGWRAEVNFGLDRVLVAARHLVGLAGVTLAPCAEVEYVHLLFDRHEIVLSEGAPSESFHPGGIMAESAPDVRDEILAVFPELAQARAEDLVSAAYVVRASEARVFHVRSAPGA